MQFERDGQQFILAEYDGEQVEMIVMDEEVQVHEVPVNEEEYEEYLFAQELCSVCGQQSGTDVHTCLNCECFMCYECTKHSLDHNGHSFAFMGNEIRREVLQDLHLRADSDDDNWHYNESENEYDDEFDGGGVFIPSDEDEGIDMNEGIERNEPEAEEVEAEVESDSDDEDRSFSEYVDGNEAGDEYEEGDENEEVYF